MEMQQIRYFTALVETLNFTRAAEACNVTQPALTRSIQNLEGELGGPLFHRERGNTHLSELGRIMAPYFENIREKAHKAKDAAKAFEALERVRLKIGVMCTIGPGTISAFLMRFCEEHPEVEIDVVDRSAGALGDMLVKGDLEIALFAIPGDLDERFHGLPLFDERFVFVAPHNHRLAKLNEVPCRELNGEPYVNRANCEFYDLVHEEFVNRGIRTRKVFSSERNDWVLAMIRAGMGFGYFPEFSVIDQNVDVRPLVDPEFVRTTNLVTVRGRVHSPAVGAFVRQASNQKWRKNTLE
jgi:DNA-binding transcriptional LysR family regulator